MTKNRHKSPFRGILTGVFILLLTGFFLFPDTCVTASQNPQKNANLSGMWDVTISDPGGWQMVDETMDNFSVTMPAAEVQLRLELTMSGSQVTGYFQSIRNDYVSNLEKTCSSEGITCNPDWFVFMDASKSGSVNGTVQGDELTLTIGRMYQLEGIIIDESMQGTGKGLAWVIGERGAVIPDYPITFTAYREEGTGPPKSACQAIISLPSVLAPGDTFFPSVEFTGLDGKPLTELVQPRWYINGVETNSLTWDGSALTVELQYTCPDKTAHSETKYFPAYNDSAQPPADQSGGTSGDQPSDEKSGGTNADQPFSGSDAGSAAVVITDPIKVVGGGTLAVGGVIGGLISAVTSLLNIFRATPIPKVRPTVSAGHKAVTQHASVKTPADKASASPGGKNETPGEGSGYQKDTIDATNEAADGFIGGVGDFADKVGEFKEKIDDLPLSKETKEKIKEKLSNFGDRLEKGKKQLEKMSKPLSKLKELRDVGRKIEKHLEQNRQFGKEMNEASKDLPEGVKNQTTDLARVIDGTGRALGEGLNYVPGYKLTGGEKTWEVQKSFQEGAKGLQKSIRTMHTSDVEMKQQGLEKEFQDKKSVYEDPEYQELQRELKNQTPQEPGFISRVWQAIIGKPVDPSVIRNR